MSLINQMLKELDARRSEVTGTDSYGQQIRAVPDRRSVHPAWWVAGTLGLVSSGLLAWVLLRPPVGDPTLTAKLPLKFDPSLGSRAAAPLPVAVQPSESIAANAAVSTATTESAAVAPAPESVASLEASQPASTRPQSEATAALTNTTVPPPEKASAPKLQTSSQAGSKRAEVKHADAASSVKEKSASVAVPDTARYISPAKAMVAASSAATVEQPASPAKQVKEFTPQQRAENEYRRAVASLQQGKPAEAIAGLEQALQFEPRHAGARQALIGALIESKRVDDSMRVARDGLNIDPAQPGLAMILARLQLEKGELHSAIETLERGLTHAGDRAEYQAFLAALLQRDGQNKKAADQYLLALQKSPQNGVWWMGLGISLQADQRPTDAQEAFRRAKSSNGLSPELLAFVDARLAQLQHR